MRFIRFKSRSTVENAAEDEGEALHADDNDFQGDGTDRKTDWRTQTAPCKPDLSCWSVLPAAFTTKLDKLRR